ncbi:MAG: nucleotidyltransferase domain-containing protein [Candidatus Nanohaloarchaeota archaeon QJJ-5]|nr:nucleotidyltransferase domain-containing protein [Candidatus Nanohaloarchaeota archaeon QJJ-5]
MNTDQLEQLRADCSEPLEAELGPYLKAVWVYGSAARQEQTEGSDIDILVLLDDTADGFDEDVYKTAKTMTNDIENNHENKDLHFQPPKLLSHWWELIISGEPWAVTSIKDAQVLYDKSGYLALTKQLLEAGEMHGTYERAQRLMERSREKVRETNELMLEDITSELLSAMTEAARAVLMYYGNPPPAPSRIGSQLQETFVETEDLLPQQAVDDYTEFYRVTEKIAHGSMTDIDGEELDTYIEEAIRFIQAMAKLFDELESRKQHDIVEQSHEKAIELCEQALAAEGVQAPSDEDELLAEFKDVFVDAGMISEEYLDILESIMETKQKAETDGVDELPEKDIYSSRVHLRDFESAITRVLEMEDEPDIEPETTQDPASGIGPFKEFCDRLLEDQEHAVKAVWLLSKEDLDETEDASVIILYDDLSNDGYSQKMSLKSRAQEAGAKIGSEYGITVHPTFYDLTDYWNLVRHGSPVTYSEIREGIPLYDPSGFFLPLKKLLDKGKIPGTKEAMRSLIAKAPRRINKIEKKYKAQVIEQMYNAVVDAGQAILIVHGVAAPVQKDVPDTLQRHLVDEGILSERDVEQCRNVISYWKDYEHDEIERIEGEDLNDVLKDAEAFIETAEHILADIDPESLL